LITVYHKALIFYLLISLGRYMTPNVIEIFRSKSNVTMVAFVKNYLLFIIIRTVNYRAFKLCMLVGLTEDMSPVVLFKLGLRSLSQGSLFKQ